MQLERKKAKLDKASADKTQGEAAVADGEKEIARLKEQDAAVRKFLAENRDCEPFVQSYQILNDLFEKLAGSVEDAAGEESQLKTVGERLRTLDAVMRDKDELIGRIDSELRPSARSAPGSDAVLPEQPREGQAGPAEGQRQPQCAGPP